MGHGIDRTSVKVTPGEAILPVRTTRALGRSRLSALIQATNAGKRPRLGIRKGGKYAEGSVPDEEGGLNGLVTKAFGENSGQAPLPSPPMEQAASHVSGTPVNDIVKTMAIPHEAGGMNGLVTRSFGVNSGQAPMPPAQVAKAANINPTLPKPANEPPMSAYEMGASVRNAVGEAGGSQIAHVMNAANLAGTEISNVATPVVNFARGAFGIGKPSATAPAVATPQATEEAGPTSYPGLPAFRASQEGGATPAAKPAFNPNTESSLNGKPLVDINSNPNVTMSTVSSPYVAGVNRGIGPNEGKVAGTEEGFGVRGNEGVESPYAIPGTGGTAFSYGAGVGGNADVGVGSANLSPAEKGLELQTKAYKQGIENMKEAAKSGLTQAEILKGAEANFGAMPEAAQEAARQRAAELERANVAQTGETGRAEMNIEAQQQTRASQAMENTAKAEEQEAYRKAQAVINNPNATQKEKDLAYQSLGIRSGGAYVVQSKMNPDTGLMENIVVNKFTGQPAEAGGQAAATQEHSKEALDIQKQFQSGKLTKEEAIKKLQEMGYQ